jgi:hypothetical protein
MKGEFMCESFLSVKNRLDVVKASLQAVLEEESQTDDLQNRKERLHVRAALAPGRNMK